MDYNQVILATLFANLGNHKNAEIDENMIRHMFLNLFAQIGKSLPKSSGK